MILLHPSVRLASLALALSLVLGTTGSASTVVFTNQHIDFEAEFHGGEVELGFHDEDTDTHYSLEDYNVEIFIGLDQTVRRNGASAGSGFDFLGVNAGDEFYVLPFSFSPSELDFLFGAGTSDNTPDVVFLGLANGLRPQFPTINFEFQRDLFEGPGVFSLFSAFGELFASSSATAPDSAPSTIHNHYNWAFSEAGTYILPFKVTATNANGDSVESEIFNFTVQIGPRTTVIPEPASIAMMSMGVLVVGGVAVARRRRQGSESASV
ncbi:choice-of-anchor M domain-containing protein [Tautonia rosea]|uniref:choice-of-anchor M domain-containing protein n=1 Tax=Tautonia rosea TaxID=2728037 RepID=UPI00147610AE|nr:choice-of-anchor M domain-containing protein [Tautonia rosea]